METFNLRTITIFRLKKGISYDKEDINYDLFKLAMRVSAKRLFPKHNWGSKIL